MHFTFYKPFRIWIKDLLTSCEYIIIVTWALLTSLEYIIIIVIWALLTPLKHMIVIKFYSPPSSV